MADAVHVAGESDSNGVLPHLRRTEMTLVSLPKCPAERSAATLNNPSSPPKSVTAKSTSSCTTPRRDVDRPSGGSAARCSYLVDNQSRGSFVQVRGDDGRAFSARRMAVAAPMLPGAAPATMATLPFSPLMP